MPDLKARQEEMRRKWLRTDGEPDGRRRREPRKRGVTPIPRKEYARMRYEEEAAERQRERIEIAELAARTDLICPTCKTKPTRASKKTGEILQCPTCRQRTVLLRKYGLTVRDYANLLQQQNGQCAICEETMKEPHVDHSHIEGHVRALLCGPCNIGLGCFYDNPRILRNAANYLISHRMDCMSPVVRTLSSF